MEKQRRQRVNRRLVLLKNFVTKNRSKNSQDSTQAMEGHQLLAEMFNNPLMNMKKPADGTSEKVDKHGKKETSSFGDDFVDNFGRRPKLRRTEGIQNLAGKHVLRRAEGLHNLDGIQRLRRTEGVHNLKQFFDTQMTEFEKRFPTNVHVQLYQCEKPYISLSSPGQNMLCENETLPSDQKDCPVKSEASMFAVVPGTYEDSIRKTYISPILGFLDNVRGQKRSRRMRSKCKGPMYTSTPKKMLAEPHFPTFIKADLPDDSPCLMVKERHNDEENISPKTSTPLKSDNLHQIQYNFLAQISTPVLSTKCSGSSKRNKSQGNRRSLKIKKVKSRLFSRSRSFSDTSSIQSYGFV